MTIDTATSLDGQPVGADTDRPSIPRVYDYSLGGKDNYEVDRSAFERIRRIAPRQGDVHHMNRRWLARVVRSLAEGAAVQQFLDLGAGLPTRDPLHVVAQECGRKDVEVVYVDNDPLCVAHGRVMLERNENTHYLPGDLTDAAAILDDAGRYLNMREPIAVLLGAVLHHLDDDHDPAGVVSRYIELLPAGSYVAITHYCDPGPGDAELHELAGQLEKAHTGEEFGSGRYRSPQHIRELFGSLDLVEPGLTPLDEWWPQGPPVRTKAPEEHLILGGLGRKPGYGRIRAVGSENLSRSRTFSHR
ncbi:SAM-dependent methyltransferase [Nocardia sp. NBC_01329]|uniref:SAM-dependent methyltransferase n=1 Tax=Nocardia sp. NBC_01329 TaxID=2903594 RepID=UPI002E1158D5|nr:SAM-dependent methyltransferase [Nocardia sp. NBC_01329]